MRQLIAVFFLLILSSQVLPLKQVGKVLFKSQITEEEVAGHGMHEKDAEQALKLFTHLSPNGNNAQGRIELLTAVLSCYLHTSESIPDNHSSEIFAPPPNRFFITALA